MTLKVVVSLPSDVYFILDVRVPKLEAAPVELEEDIMFVSLFTFTTAPPPPPRERATRHRSICTSESEDARAQKKEQTDMEAAMRASLVDEDTR